MGINKTLALENASCSSSLSWNKNKNNLVDKINLKSKDYSEMKSKLIGINPKLALANASSSPS